MLNVVQPLNGDSSIARPSQWTIFVTSSGRPVGIKQAAILCLLNSSNVVLGLFIQSQQEWRAVCRVAESTRPKAGKLGASTSQPKDIGLDQCIEVLGLWHCSRCCLCWALVLGARSANIALRGMLITDSEAPRAARSSAKASGKGCPRLLSTASAKRFGSGAMPSSLILSRSAGSGPAQVVMKEYKKDEAENPQVNVYWLAFKTQPGLQDPADQVRAAPCQGRCQELGSRPGRHPKCFEHSSPAEISWGDSVLRPEPGLIARTWPTLRMTNMVKLTP